METSKRGLQVLSRGLFALVIYLVHQGVFAYPAYEIVNPLFNNGSVMIYPESRHPRSQIRDWCGSRTNGDPLGKLEVVYDGAHSRRDSLFPQGYEAFVDTSVRSVLNHYCSDTNPANVELYFYRRGETEYLDKVRFQLRDGNGVNTVARVSESINTAHPSNNRLVAENELGRCSGKPFCDVTGGRYLNAIYANDEALIRQLDEQTVSQMRSSEGMQVIEDFASILSGGGIGEDQRQDVFGLQGSSLLQHVAIKYMALYGKAYAHSSTNGSCLQDDARSITREDRTELVKFEDQYGIDQGAVGGDSYGEVYTINKEFVPLCNTVCSATGDDGANFFASSSQSSHAELVISGVDQVINDFDCNSAEVKQFERNLISLTESSLQREPTSSSPRQAERSDAEQAQDTRRLFMEAMEEQTPQARTTRTRTATPQAQASTSRQGETSRMARLAAQPVINESVLSDLDGNLKAGEQFLTANRNNDGVIETSSGLQYRIIESGSGRAPESGDQVTAHMRLTLLNGHVIHDTYAEGEPSTFAPYQSIEGFNEGLKLLKAGGKIQLFIPPSLAYGNRAAGEIPAGSTFIYDVELLSID